MSKLLDIQNLSVVIGDKKVVDHVSFSLNKGEILCVVGESGSGKTLSALSIMRLLPDVAGFVADKMSFDDHDILNMPEEAHRKLRGRDMAMIFQEPMTSLNPVLKVGEQVAEVFRVHTDWPAHKIKVEVIELFKKVKLPEPERRYEMYPFELSGGQRQRVMIAMALAMKPKLLIADEPTTALDVTVQGEILQLMKDLQQEMNMSVLFITHDFGVVQHMADRVAVMENGTLVEEGKVTDVMTKPQHPYTQKLLDAMPQMSTKGKAKAKAPELLRVKDVRKTFMVKKGGFFSKKEPFDALKGVSFHLGEGETVGIVGESGCGKSTLARCLTRLYDVDGGEITFNGVNVAYMNKGQLRDVRKNMQMVFQDPFSSLNPRMKVGEIVGEGLRAHKLMGKEARQRFVKELLKDCGLPEDAYQRYPHQFSGGQRQRIGIARALALKPKLIIADEPVSALDVSVQKQILDLMRDLKKKYQLSYVFISHDLRVVSQVCDQVIVMKDGEIVEQGDVGAVFKKPAHAYTQKLIDAIPR